MVTNIATVGVQGVNCSLPKVYTNIILPNGIMLFSYTPVGYYIHIGVGSNVVCSTIPGNAKASVRGTDSKEVPTLFYALKTNLKSPNRGTIGSIKK